MLFRSTWILDDNDVIDFAILAELEMSLRSEAKGEWIDWRISRYRALFICVYSGRVYTRYYLRSVRGGNCYRLRTKREDRDTCYPTVEDVW